MTATRPTQHALVPIVDLTSSIEQLARDAEHALQHVGFIVATGHQLDGAAAALRGAATRFFTGPADIRIQFQAPGAGDFIGYSPQQSESLAATDGQKAPPDLMQNWTWGRPDHIRARGPRDLVRAADAWFGSVTGLMYDTLLPAFSLVCGQTRSYLADWYGEPEPIARVNHYPAVDPADVEPGQMRIGQHTDYGPLSLVMPDGPGLQVQYGGAWVDVPWTAGSAVINPGDELELMFGLASPRHRVIPPAEPAERMTLVYFYEGHASTVVGKVDGRLITSGEWVRRKVMQQMGIGT